MTLKNARQNYLAWEENPGLDFHQENSAKVNKQTNETLKSHEMWLVREDFFLCSLVSF